MLVDGKKRLVEDYDENQVKIAMEEIASGALEVEVQEKGKK
jgi:DNA-directed RNA polymerase subunit K/omega